MISKQKKSGMRLSLAVIGSMAVLAFALLSPTAFVNACGHTGEAPCSDVGGSNSPDVGGSNSGVNINSGIKNPLGTDIPDVPSFIQKILGFILLIGVPIIVLAIIYAGFLFVIARGNSEALKKAKATLLYTLVGAALLLGSFVIAKAIQGTVDCISTDKACTEIK